MKRTLFTGLLLVLFVMSCNSSQTGEISMPDFPDIESLELETTASGLQYYDVEEGSGEMPAAGDRIVAHYAGWLTDGTEFDSSIPRGQTFSFTIGQRQVIPGWDEGIGTMKRGGVRILVIPPQLGYGSRASGPIPPNSTLVFQVYLVDFNTPPSAPDFPDITQYNFETTDSGLEYYDIEEGTGDLPEAGNRVEANYTGWLTNGTMFDSSIPREETFSFTLGRGEVIRGWDEGIATMKPGGVRILRVPPELAYGSRPAGQIPPNSTLIFQVELVSVSVPPAPPEFPDVEALSFQTTDSGLQYHDLEVGSGDSPEEGAIIEAHFTGWLMDGTMFESTVPQEQTRMFPMGHPNVPPGWNEGLETMKVGGSRLLIMPPELAYGNRSVGPIPPNSTIVYRIDLIGIQDSHH